ncbi:hypothetical protein ACWN8V_11925 [Vagococcus elongatus]|uniref:DUF4829 domain-containing protein n=1 Tax=Vagococcus elongatus TaxID=180344 RepID=A0A430B405_9ENTE|nr:hypothetical protein [Vagococcus elongatus]RSU15038.1 hypothetical protein CBF29_01485 [Vagococcus elongatus]
MKKIFPIILILLFISACRHQGLEKIILNKENHLTENQIEQAMDTVTTYFYENSSFGDKLIDISYDSDKEKEFWKHNKLPKEVVNESDKIVLFSTYKAGKYRTAATPDAIYENYMYILTKTNSNDWEIIDQGY